jgi:hypothetical protein
LWQDFKFEKKPEVIKVYPRGYCGVCKIGRPVYIERTGLIKVEEVYKICDEETLWKSYFQSYEIL